MTSLPSRRCFTFAIITAFIYTCCALNVTVDSNGPVLETSEARLSCNYTITDPRNWPTVRVVITWREMVNGSQVRISHYDGGYGEVEAPYVGRFSVEGSTLVITNTMRSDAGIYVCEVFIIGPYLRIADDRLTLVVAYLDMPVVMVYDSQVIEGDTVTVTCSVDAQPTPEYFLYHDDSEVFRQTAATLIHNINNVLRGDAGDYKCTASNVAGRTTSGVKTLVVQYAPAITPLEYIIAHPGEVVTIQFEILSIPDVIDYQWKTTPETTDTDSNPATYTFKVSEIDGQTYDITLNATNSVGSTQQSSGVAVENEGCNNYCLNGGMCFYQSSGDPVCACGVDYSGINCETENECSTVGFVIGMIFASIFSGAVCSFISLMGYTRIKSQQKKKNDTTEKVTNAHDAYMTYRTEGGRPTDDRTYEDLQHKDDEHVIYVNINQGKRPK